MNLFRETNGIGLKSKSKSVHLFKNSFKTKKYLFLANLSALNILECVFYSKLIKDKGKPTQGKEYSFLNFCTFEIFLL